MHSASRTGKDNKYKSGTGGSRMGALKNLYSSLNSKYSKQFGGHEKKKRNKKSAPSPKMDYIRKKPDYADTAYHEAVGRLRILLAESYSPRRHATTRELLNTAGDDTDNQSIVSVISRTSKYPLYNTLGNYRKYYPVPRISTDNDKREFFASSPELSTFLERQEDYIDQLERESRFCREELSTLLGKVKEVILENENLHEKQKDKLLKTVFDQFETELDTDSDAAKPAKSASKESTLYLEGPSIVYESRISELEAKLTQARIDLKKCQEDNEQCHRNHADYIGDGSMKKQVESLKNDNTILQETVTKLQTTLSSLRDKEHSSTDHVKRSLDIAEQAQFEKNAAEHEIRRLKDELERQHGKLREALNEQSRRVADERASVERRYSQQIEQLSSELGVHWEQSNKLQLELDKQRRESADLRRESAQKQALIDELKKEMQNKILTLQSDIGVSGAEKSALEHQIASLQMGNERTERQSKQESARLQVEMQSLRQRLDRADADLIHSRRENLRLTEQIAALEKEINMNNALADEKSKMSKVIALPAPPMHHEEKEKERDETAAKIQDLEAKHVATVAELEGMIQTQNQLMDKLSAECHALTQKLEESSTVHKVEIRELQANLETLSNKLADSQLHKDINPQAEKVENIEPNAPRSQGFTGKEADPNYYDQNQYDNKQYDEVGNAYATHPEGNYDQQQYLSQEQYDQQYGQYDPNVEPQPQQQAEQDNFEELYKENQDGGDAAPNSEVPGTEPTN